MDINKVERYDHNANLVTGTPIDWESDMVPIKLFEEQMEKANLLEGTVRIFREFIGYERSTKMLIDLCNVALDRVSDE
uniref:Uncharacterized protein n=1 Tax=viral metagenome TaxID=1070528 RepID=A0A6M3KUR4_9ZZZZ